MKEITINSGKFLRKLELYFKRLKLFFTKRKKGSLRVGHCIMCGECCRNLGLLLDGKKISSEAEFLALIEKEPEYSVFFISGSSDDGTLIFSCSALNEFNQCSLYANRPEVCRDYPDLYLMSLGGGLHEGCGYELYPPHDFEEYLKKASGESDSGEAD